VNMKKNKGNTRKCSRIREENMYVSRTFPATSRSALSTGTLHCNNQQQHVIHHLIPSTNPEKKAVVRHTLFQGRLMVRIYTAKDELFFPRGE
jgi:hypothetical protein